jgi:hypothetical protein
MATHVHIMSSEMYEADKEVVVQRVDEVNVDVGENNLKANAFVNAGRVSWHRVAWRLVRVRTSLRSKVRNCPTASDSVTGSPCWHCWWLQSSSECSHQNRKVGGAGAISSHSIMNSNTENSNMKPGDLSSGPNIKVFQFAPVR